MKKIDLAALRRITIDEKTRTDSYARFIVEPFDKGYGHTIGNAIRRVLLSSIEGAAITSVRIKGVMHEYATIPGVKEDVMGIILNLKKVRVKMFSSEPHEVLKLDVKSKGEVTAADIASGNPNVEIINPKQHIATLNPGGTSLSMEMEVSRGYGYATAEENKKHGRPAGTIFIDSLFSPIVKVNYEVENTRVEQFTDFEKIILDIWTDGTIQPVDALAYSAKLLRETLSVFVIGGESKEESKDIAASSSGDIDVSSVGAVSSGGEGDVAGKKSAGADETDDASASLIEEKRKELLEQPVEILGLSKRPANCLEKHNIRKIKDLIKLSEDALLNYENMGKSSVAEIKKKLAELDLALRATSR